MASTNPSFFIGIMTGTSMDAVDVVIAQFNTSLKVTASVSVPFDADLRAILLGFATAKNIDIDLLTRSNVLLARVYADVVAQALSQAHLTPDDIVAIGMHGQTIRHLPKPETIAKNLPPVSGTYQLGSGAALAALSGIDVVSDFRSADMSLGGQGAPLMPMFDYAFMGSKECNRICLNIGGIANITFLPANASEEEVQAFDTGPGNMLIDGLTQEYFHQPFDHLGDLARGGVLNMPLLEDLLATSYFHARPPKSTGRELFGAPLLLKLKTAIESKRISPCDALATATELTARSIAQALEFLPPRRARAHSTELIVSGGGVYNRFLCERLQALLPNITFRISDELQVPAQAKEALAFAWFAKAFIEDKVIHLPHTTGASRKTRLGSLSKHGASA